MAFKYYYEYLNPEGAPEMPEDTKGDEIIKNINRDERTARSSFINLAVLTVTLVFCALCVFVLRENDYSRFEEGLKPDKENLRSGEFTASLEGDVLSHLALEEKIIRTDNFLHYFCGVGNELMKAEKREEPEYIIGGAFMQQSANGGSGLPGGTDNDTTHVVSTRVTDAQKHTEGTQKTKAAKKTNDEKATRATAMTTREEYGETTTTTTTTTEASTTTAVTNNKAPDVTTKVTTKATTTEATTKKVTTKKTTKKTTAPTQTNTTASETKPVETSPTQASSDEETDIVPDETPDE